MCGRFVSQLPAELIARLFAAGGDLPNTPPSWNVAPTDAAMVIRRHSQTGKRHLGELRWGLVPGFTKDIKTARRPINARSETVASSGMFRAALQARRCLVPADAFYEWRTVADGKQPYAIARADGAPMAFAGLWEAWRDPDGEVLRSFVIATTTANEDMRALHERMPVILEQEDWPVWLGEADGDFAGLLRPLSAGITALAGQPGGEQRAEQRPAFTQTHGRRRRGHAGAGRSGHQPRLIAENPSRAGSIRAAPS